MRLDGKVVLITGAGSGLGRECAFLFASEGACLVLVDISAERVAAVAAEVGERGGDAVPVTADVRVEAEIAAAVDSAVTRYGRLDVMFANAGILGGLGATPIDRMDQSTWDAVVGTNLTGVFLSCKHAARVMKPQRAGSIVVTSSAASFVAYPGVAVYSASKAGTNGLVKGLSWELGAHGIRINAVCPAHGMSPNFLLPPEAPVVGQSYEESAGNWDPNVSPIPLKLGRPPTLRDNAQAVLYLASDESAYVTGVLLPSVDGGTLSRVAMTFEDGWQSDVVSHID